MISPKHLTDPRAVRRGVLRYAALLCGRLPLRSLPGANSRYSRKWSLSAVRISLSTRRQRLEFGIALPPEAVVIEQILGIVRKTIGPSGLLHHKEPISPMLGLGSIGMEREASADQGAKPLAPGQGFLEFRHNCISR